DTYHAGFLLGPRVNAGGRVGEADLGARLLATDDAAEAAALACRLDAYNEERRAIEAAVLAEAMAQIEAGPAPVGLVFAAGEGWHPGVIGIVASRLKDRFNLPAVVVALDPGTATAKGSGRSVPGVDLGAAVIAARQAGLLVNGGGHPMAAGLTTDLARVSDLRAFLSERLGAALAASGYRPALGFDGVLHPGGATADLVRAIERCAPFGAGNPQPRFAVAAARIVRADVVGENHVRCILAGADDARLKAIAFRAMDTALGPALLATGGRPLHLAGKLRLDEWAGGDAVQFVVEDAAPA
ncbi:MAG: single-stranded-DNA-specific exonuclease RecJ, partial [Alphaproteobacteria bacterium]